MAINPDNGQRLGREAILRRLKALNKVRMSGVTADDHVKRLRGESDRGVMILAATMVEDALVTALQRELKHANTSEMRDKLFGGDGPLSSFSKRISFAQAMGMAPKEVCKQMHTVREVRNVAAHAHVDVDFSVQQIKDALGSMLDDEKAVDLETWPRDYVRSFYLNLCGYMADSVLGPIGGPSMDAIFIALRASVLDDAPPSRDR